jgi:hypothetical protein
MTRHGCRRRERGTCGRRAVDLARGRRPDGYVADRRALQVAMLDTWEEPGTDRVIDDVDAA